MSHYDHIPAGKKPFKDPLTGEWSLIDLDEKDPKDLAILLAEEKAKNKVLLIEKEKLLDSLALNKEDRLKLEAVLKAPKKELEKFIEKHSEK